VPSSTPPTTTPRPPPERDAIFADWAARSAKVRREYAGRLDLAYGDAPRERLDLFLAADPQAPTLAFIHGGYWQMNDKENFAFFAEGLLLSGSISRSSNIRWPRRGGSIASSPRYAVGGWLADHLAEYGAYPNRLYVAGHD
jgi:arylformamidase